MCALITVAFIKALIREHPEQLSVEDASGHTPLTLATAAPLPAPILGLPVSIRVR